MSKIDTERIKNMTNEMIGYENYKKERTMKKKKIRSVAFIMLGAITLSMGTLTVDALTNNAMSNTIKKIFSVNVKVDGKEEKASCRKNDDGTITCTIGEENTVYEIKENIVL